jgi:hypothetical protein
MAEMVRSEGDRPRCDATRQRPLSTGMLPSILGGRAGLEVDERVEGAALHAPGVSEATKGLVRIRPGAPGGREMNVNTLVIAAFISSKEP